SVLQRMAARRPAHTTSSGIGMLWDLAHQPPWLAGIGAMLCGFLLQAGALATGPIALVQPVLILELGFTLLLSAAVFHSPLHRREWAAVIGMSVGLALLLLGLGPTGGNTRAAPALTWIIGTALTLAVVVVLVLAGHHYHHSRRAEYFGIAT